VIAIFGRQFRKDSRIASGIPVASELLRLKKSDGLAQLRCIFWLLEPIALGMSFIRPADKIGSNGLRDSATRAASGLNIKILSS